jgi:phage gp36-like protein
MSNINYIDKDDYTISISIENLNDILAQGVELSGLTEETLMDNSELTAQAEIRAYLSSVYDIDGEFDLSFDDAQDTRNKLILRCCVNLSLFNLHMTINPRDVPEKVANAYEHCLEGLEAARKGELDLGLPAPPDNGDGSVSWRHIGSNLKFTSKPFHEARIIDDSTNG